jgi:predicted membrane protein
MPVTRLDMSMGAGQADLDLAGDRKNDLVANLEGGVGQVTIRLPRKVGVVVQASGGIGAVDAHGLRHENDEYTNEAYGKTPATIHLKVQGGIGQISLIEEP